MQDPRVPKKIRRGGEFDAYGRGDRRDDAMGGLGIIDEEHKCRLFLRILLGDLGMVSSKLKGETYIEKVSF